MFNTPLKGNQIHENVLGQSSSTASPPVPPRNNVNPMHNIRSQQQQQPAQEIANDFQQVARISVRPPPFWRENPALWFKQLESQFITNGITASDTKFHTAVSALDTAVIAQVSDVVMNPPVNGKYELLKQRLQERFADSEEQRFRKLIGDVHLGDKKPSHLWREMRELAGNNNYNEQMLRSLWMQRLPTQSQAILSAEDGNIDRMLTLADRVHEIFGTQSINAVAISHSPPPPPQLSAIEKLCEQVSQLTTQVAALSSRQNHHTTTYKPRSRSASRSDDRSSRSNTPTATQLCWYHRRFGIDANKCISPCNYKPAEN